jgi:hypothetical protein
VTGAAVPELPRRRIDDRAEHGAAHRPGHPAGEGVERRQHLGRRAALEQQRPPRAAELTHHGRRTETPAHDVADHDAVAAVRQVHHVVPVTADLEGVRRGLVVRREPGRQHGGPEDGPLEGDGHLAEEAHPGPLDRRALVGPLPFALERPGVGDGCGDLAGDEVQEAAVVLVQPQPRTRPEDERADGRSATRDHERQGHRGVDLDLPQGFHRRPSAAGWRPPSSPLGAGASRWREPGPDRAVQVPHPHTCLVATRLLQVIA